MNTTSIDATGVKAVPAPRTACEPVPRTRPANPFDTASAEDVVAALPDLPDFPKSRDAGRQQQRFARALLRRLEAEPGRTWQERWESLETRYSGAWNDDIVADLTRTLRGSGPRAQTDCYSFGWALGLLIQLRLLRPGYPFLRGYKASALHTSIRASRCPELFAQLSELSQRQGMSLTEFARAIRVLTTILIHTGKDLNELAADDLLDFDA